MQCFYILHSIFPDLNPVKNLYDVLERVFSHYLLPTIFQIIHLYEWKLLPLCCIASFDKGKANVIIISKSREKFHPILKLT